MRILHVAAHLGGGAGKAIFGIAVQGRRDFHDEHRILLLQPPEKTGYVQKCAENGIPAEVWDGSGAALEWADAVVVSWWNHPSMARFLRELSRSGPPMVLWSHVNGCHYPFLPFQLTEAFEAVLFTAPYSLENPAWTTAERRRIRERAGIVYGMGQFDPEAVPPKADYGQRETFTIGYAGTLNYGKLHPAFVSFCKAACARIPNARFVMAGDRDAALERDLRAAGLWERFSFPGFVSDVPALMRTFDVFGYLLNPEHYGTTENVLLEAMACGLPCVVLRQNVEQYIVPSEGAVETPEQYGGRLAFLQSRPDERERLGRGARSYVLERYDAAENAARFRAACVKAAEGPRRMHDFSSLEDTPWQWFLYCLDSADRHRFEQALGGTEAGARELMRTCPPILRERRKSSLRHFAAVYPEDRSLQFFNQWMEDT